MFLESQLRELFTKTIKQKLPEHAKKTLVKALPWIALGGGVLTLLGAWGVYAAATVATPFMMLSVTDAAYGYAPMMQRYTGFIWLGFLLLLVEAIIMFVAFSPLQQRSRRGWMLMYWVSLINIAYALLYLFISFNPVSLVVSLVASGVGLYLLFQIRDYYLGEPGASKSSGSAHNKK
ncbi:MAG TPA: hypothetical protein VFT87_00495 [Candidatus Saccharimonadales bacterium]|nr:hypothetical protein [Candidatus Saccharimonadales bacterium]